MSTEQLIVGGLVMLVALLATLIGLAMIIRGASSARNAVLALRGPVTRPGDGDADADTTTVKLSGTVAEDVIAGGDDQRVVGTIEPAPADGGDCGRGRRPTRHPAESHAGATVAGGSWRALAWTEAKSAVKLPAGLLGMGLAAPFLLLAQFDVISLGLGL